MKQVLSGRKTTDRTIGIHENWSWGPIGDHRVVERIAFMRREDPTPWDDYWDSLPEKNADFWGQIEAWPNDILVWLGSSSALELAGYLAFLDRLRDRRAFVLRPDGHLPPHPRFGPPGTTGTLDAAAMAECLDHAPRQAVVEDLALFERWAELVEENAVLRVLGNGSLVSASIDYHDHFILGAARNEWMNHVRVIGHAMGATFDARTWVSDAFLFSRLAHLVDEGVLEADGDVRAYTEDFRRSEARVRLPAKAI